MIRHASGNAATAEIALIEAAAIKAFLEDIDQVHESRLQRASARSGIAIQEQEYNWTPYRHTERLGDGQYFFKTIVKKPVKRSADASHDHADHDHDNDHDDHAHDDHDHYDTTTTTTTAAY